MMRANVKNVVLASTVIALIAAFAPTASAGGGADALGADTFVGPRCFVDEHGAPDVDEPRGLDVDVIAVHAVALEGNTPDPHAWIACWLATPTVSDMQWQTKLDATSGDPAVTNSDGVITGARSFADDWDPIQDVYLCESDNGGTAYCTLLPSV